MDWRHWRIRATAAQCLTGEDRLSTHQRKRSRKGTDWGTTKDDGTLARGGDHNRRVPDKLGRGFGFHQDRGWITGYVRRIRTGQEITGRTRAFGRRMSPGGSVGHRAIIVVEQWDRPCDQRVDQKNAKGDGIVCISLLVCKFIHSRHSRVRADTRTIACEILRVHNRPVKPKAESQRWDSNPQPLVYKTRIEKR